MRTMAPDDLVEAAGLPGIRLYRRDDYALLLDWSRLLPAFYDGHGDGAPALLDQLIGHEQGDPLGLHTTHKLILVCEGVGRPTGALCLNHKRGGSTKLGPLLIDRGAPHKRVVATRLFEAALTIARLTGRRKLYGTFPRRNAGMAAVILGVAPEAGLKQEAAFPDHFRTGVTEAVWGMHLDKPPPAVASVSSSLESGRGQAFRIGLYEDEDWGYFQSAYKVCRQWHDDADDELPRAQVAAHWRGLAGGDHPYQRKSTRILVARGHDGHRSGFLILTPKRGGPAKLYPLIGTALAQKELLQAAIAEVAALGGRKLYTFAHERDERQLAFLEAQGFVRRGLLESPYRPGHNLVPMDRPLGTRP
jgi:hypothetical protein